MDLALGFSSTVNENDVLRRLQDAAKDGKLGDFDVNASSIVGARPQTGATPSTKPTSSPESEQGCCLTNISGTQQGKSPKGRSPAGNVLGASAKI